MVDILLWYMSVGAAIYAVFLAREVLSRGAASFYRARLIDIVAGILFVPLWPLLLWHVEVVDSGKTEN